MPIYHLSIKSGKKGKAESHSNYIARLGRYGIGEKEGDLIAKQHGNLPAWSGNNPAIFWSLADETERINGAAYREFEVALPSELPPEKQIELVEKFIADEVGTKPFQYAIHAPDASMGGVKQPHAHIMFSDRKPDGIERGPYQHFRRFNPKAPDKGGARKDSGGRDTTALREQVVSIRKNWENTQNEFLAANGHTERVDHRSHADRGLSQQPERYLGPARIAKMGKADRDAYVANRGKSKG